MNICLARLLAFPILVCSMALAAAPRITPLGEPDKHGAIAYSVVCDNERRKIVQCVGDDRHCGYAGDQPLAELADAACAAAPAASTPEPSGDAPPFETAPIRP